jgi:hypothetical protein
MSLSVCGEDRTLGMTRLDIDVFFDRHLAEKRRLYLANGSSWICTQASSHGRCMRGPSCPYKHTRNLQPPVCKFWLRGGCKRGADACGDLHIYDMNRMPLCQFMSEHGQKRGRGHSWRERLSFLPSTPPPTTLSLLGLLQMRL